ncbi:unnamed protein product [Agarophyton chilense]|eukprot:gb/GEZJ01002877.1/.p1 GENE.gb/GEZJ01002877.1/~~gb/GEZJ01002877.1/.p1  ORF type:complete len:542 (-),score=80.59 gb/GEZJ01002877.1/:574-2199(-)
MKSLHFRHRTAFLTSFPLSASTFHRTASQGTIPQTSRTPKASHVYMNSFPPDTESKLPQPKIPTTPIDPTLGAQTVVTQALSIDPEEETTWFESILASKQSLTQNHPLKTLRENAGRDVHDLVIPGKKIESWRFTNLATVYASRYVPFSIAHHDSFGVSDIRRYVPDTAGIVLVFIDGVYNERLSLLNDDSGKEWLAEGGYFGSILNYKGDISRVTQMLMDAELGTKEGGMFPTIGNCICNDAAILHIPANFSISRPVAVLNLYSGGPQEGLSVACAPRLAVVAETRSKLVLLESHGALSDSYSLALPGTAVYADPNASVHHYLINDLGPCAQLISNVHANIFSGASYEIRHVGIGGALGRYTLGMDLKGPEANVICHGASISTDEQVMDVHSRINHDSQSCTSNQLQKNIAADRSRAIFNGKIIVTRNGDKTDSEQLCKSLLLSKRAGIDAMPVLEIATDDVKCSHGATVADLEEDELFYCQSRGLSLPQAQFLLVAGFARDVLGDCPFPTVLEQLNAKVDLLSNTRLERDTDFSLLSSI